MLMDQAEVLKGSQAILKNPGHEKLGYINTQKQGGTGVGHSTNVGSTRPSHSWRYAHQAKPELSPTIYQTLKTAHKA